MAIYFGTSRIDSPGADGDVVKGEGISLIKKLTKDEYDALETKDESTMYVISDDEEVKEAELFSYPISHNCVFRGKYLGDSVTDKQRTAIVEGTWDDIFIGDYWTFGGINFRIASLSLNLSVGVNPLVLLPDSTTVMSSLTTDTATYIGEAQASLIPGNSINSLFLLLSAQGFSTLGSRYAETMTQINKESREMSMTNFSTSLTKGFLMAFENIYGYSITTLEVSRLSSDNCAPSVQFPLFRLAPEYIPAKDGNIYWLRTMTDDNTKYLGVNGSGRINSYDPTTELYLRPYFPVRMT